MRATACAISTPTGPPPSTSIRFGTSFSPVTSRFVHRPSSSFSPSIGGNTGSEPVEITMFLAVWVSSPTRPARPVEAALAADQSMPSTRASSPGRCRRSPTPGSRATRMRLRRRPWSPTTSRAPGASRAAWTPPRDAGASSTECRRSRSTRRPRARAPRAPASGRLGQPAGAMLARGPASEDDRVVVRAVRRSPCRSPPPAGRCRQPNRRAGRGAPSHARGADRF